MPVPKCGRQLVPLTVATGQVFGFANYFVGFTSNLGAAEAMRMEHSKFASIEQAVLRRVEQTLRPELLGRIDEKIVFARLSSDVQREICALEIAKETARLRGLGFDLEISRETVEFPVREGFHPQLGARPLRKAVERLLQDAVARDLLATGVGCGRIEVDAGFSRLSVRRS